MIEIDQMTQDLDHPRDPLVPTLAAFAVERGLADILVIGLVAAHRVMRQFEMRHDSAILEDRGAGAGAEGQHHLDAFALDCPEALDIGVVQDSHRLFPLLGERALQIEAGP